MILSFYPYLSWQVDGDKKIEWILAFIRKYLKLDDNDHLVTLEFFVRKTVIRAIGFPCSLSTSTKPFLHRQIKPSETFMNASAAMAS